MEKSFEYKVNLKQQTPIIHFQHDQSGATLRATEVKPKLDAFIIKKLGGKAKIDKTWFINSDVNALNYKLRFEVSGEPDKKSKAGEYAIESYKRKIGGDNAGSREYRNLSSREINGLYFGNMVSGSNDVPDSKKLENYSKAVKESYKETVFYKSTEMTVICFIPGLLEMIKSSIEEFFLVHNFGTRQSKGFGGFLVSNKNGEIKGKDAVSLLEKKGYIFLYADCKSTSYAYLLNNAKNIYTLLKSGYLLSDSFLKMFSVPGRKVESDKKLMKNMMLRQRYDSNFLFVRAILGLADHYEYKRPNKGIISVYSLGDDTYNIHRFKSPITIKIVGSYLIFIVDVDSFATISGKRFYLYKGRINKSEYPDYKSQKEQILRYGKTIFTPNISLKNITEMITGFIVYYNNKGDRNNSVTLKGCVPSVNN